MRNVNVYGNHFVDLDSELVKLDVEGSRPLRTPASALSLQGDTHAEHR
jgi:hypothetical protein